MNEDTRFRTPFGGNPKIHAVGGNKNAAHLAYDLKIKIPQCHKDLRPAVSQQAYIPEDRRVIATVKRKEQLWQIEERMRANAQKRRDNLPKQDWSNSKPSPIVIQVPKSVVMPRRGRRIGPIGGVGSFAMVDPGVRNYT